MQGYHNQQRSIGYQNQDQQHYQTFQVQRQSMFPPIMPPQPQPPVNTQIVSFNPQIKKTELKKFAYIAMTIRRTNQCKHGKVEAYLARCRHHFEALSELVDDSRLIEVVFEKLPDRVKTKLQNQVFNVYSLFEAAATAADEEHTRQFDWGLCEHELKMRGLDYLLPLLKEWSKDRNPHEFRTATFNHLISDFPLVFNTNNYTP